MEVGIVIHLKISIIQIWIIYWIKIVLQISCKIKLDKIRLIKEVVISQCNKIILWISLIIINSYKISNKIIMISTNLPNKIIINR